MTDDEAEEQPATAAAGNDETTIVPPATGVEAELAWSTDQLDDQLDDDEDQDDGPVSTPWHLVTGIAAAVLVCCALTAIVVWVVGNATTRLAAPAAEPVAPTTTWAPSVLAAPVPFTPPPPAPVTVTVAAPPAPAAAPVPLPDPPANQADRAFLARIHKDQVPTDDDGDAVLMGHQQCSEMRQDGTSTYDRAGQLQAALHWTFSQAFDFVTDAATAYCPQLG
jgi:hypothetical protein